MVRVVCVAVERVVTRATGRNASGTTAALQRHLYQSYKSSNQSITLYPRVMGYIIGANLNKGKEAIQSLLLGYHKKGSLASLSSSNWRP
jgi:hypothetical protein